MAGEKIEVEREADEEIASSGMDALLSSDELALVGIVGPEIAV